MIRKEFVSFLFLFLKLFWVSLFPVFLIEIGDMAKQYIGKGLLVPDHVITRLMMSELENRRDQHWLLDGELNLWVSWISVHSWVLYWIPLLFQFWRCLLFPWLSLHEYNSSEIRGSFIHNRPHELKPWVIIFHLSD